MPGIDQKTFVTLDHLLLDLLGSEEREPETTYVFLGVWMLNFRMWLSMYKMSVRGRENAPSLVWMERVMGSASRRSTAFCRDFLRRTGSSGFRRK